MRWENTKPEAQFYFPGDTTQTAENRASLEHRLGVEARAGRRQLLPPSERRRQKLETIAAEKLHTNRSALAGCRMKLLSYAGYHSFVAELTTGELAALREYNWKIVTPAETEQPFWEDWWYPAHSPEAAIAVLDTTLEHYRRIRAAHRQYVEHVCRRKLAVGPFDRVPEVETPGVF